MIEVEKSININLINKERIYMIKYSSFVLATLLAFTGCGGGGSNSGSSSGGSGVSDSNLVINEVLAENNSTNTDPDLGLYGDWIELKNISSTAFDLGGYGLSDSTKKVKWTFPNGTTIGANGLVLVWADDYNVTAHPNPTALHTNFKLKSNSDKVVLYDKTGTMLQTLDLKDHKVSQSDISIARTSDGEYILSSNPTPNSENNLNAVTVSQTPHFDKKEGVYQDSVIVTITAGNGAKIYYTKDGTTPTVNSTEYTGALTFTANKTTLKAIAKETATNKLISKEKSKTYVVTKATDRDVVINEIFSDNNSSSSDTTKNTDWVELHNVTGASINLGTYKLSDKKQISATHPGMSLSGTIGANAYKVINIDKTTSGFALSAKGDSIVLYKDSSIIDFEDFGKLKGVSYSRQGGIWDNNFTKTTNMTPGSVNQAQ